MNLAKVQVKIDILKEMGAECAKRAKEAGNSQLRQEGARDALQEASKKVGELGAFFDQDMESGLVAKCMGDVHELEKYLKRYFKRASGVCMSLSETANVSMIMAGGRKKAHAMDEDHVRIQARNEINKLDAFHKAIKSGELSLEKAPHGNAAGYPGGHPGLPMKQQRLDEEAAEKAKAEEESKTKKKKPRKKPAKTSTATGSRKKVATKKSAPKG